MKRFVIAVIALCCAPAWAQTDSNKTANRAAQRSEEKILPASAYRTPLDEVIVRGQKPYWQRETPRFDKPKVDAPKPDEAGQGRMRWAPHYSRDERDDYNQPRDQLTPQPRTKVFELRF